MNRAAPQPKENMGRPEPRMDEARYGSDFAVNNPATGPPLLTSLRALSGTGAARRGLSCEHPSPKLMRGRHG